MPEARIPVQRRRKPVEQLLVPFSIRLLPAEAEKLRRLGRAKLTPWLARFK